MAQLKWTRLAMACVVLALMASLVFAAPVPNEENKTRKADALQRAKSQHNLKQIALALHHHESAQQCLPRNFTGRGLEAFAKDAKPLLSWRVLILPYLDEEELYNQFKLDEPWDSKNNKKLLAKMPGVYRLSFQDKDDTRTYYQGFAGPGTMFEPGKRVRFADITDGTSNTLAVVEAGPPVEWTKPEDIPYDPKKPPKCEPPFANVLNGATIDGETHFFKPDIDEKNLHALIQIADGNKVRVDDLVGNYPLSAEELEKVKKLIASNEKLFEQLVTEFKERQKMLVGIATGSNGKGAAKRFREINDLNQNLQAKLEEMKRENEELKELIERAKKEK